MRRELLDLLFQRLDRVAVAAGELGDHVLKLLSRLLDGSMEALELLDERDDVR